MVILLSWLKVKTYKKNNYFSANGKTLVPEKKAGFLISVMSENFQTPTYLFAISDIFQHHLLIILCLKILMEVVQRVIIGQTPPCPLEGGML
jgi:hypothetical protein